MKTQEKQVDAVVVREPTQEISRREVTPLSVSQVTAGLKAINDVMAQCMKDGQDYGKVPGCGDKPGLFQPGAQKLSMMFQLNPEVLTEVVTDYQNFHRGYRLVVRVTNNSKFADGVGECSTMESKYRYRNANKKCPECGKETVLKSKNEGEGWFCWTKKGGCGAKFNPGSDGEKKILDQTSGKVEHDNPPDFWNTVRKMAFKRAFVHAIINATNTSELWSQDLEDLRANGVLGEESPQGGFENAKPASESTPRAKTPPTQPQSAPEASNGDWRNFRVPFGKNKGTQLGELGTKSLLWYAENVKVESSYEKDGKRINKIPEIIAKDQEFRDALDEAYEELVTSGEIEDDRVPD